MSDTQVQTDKVETYKVSGMTCQHCISAVDGKVRGVPGVTDVEIDLATGTVVVRGAGVDSTAIQVAVEEAGYSLADHV